MKRVIIYIDGFNLYFGMKAHGWRKYYWLNIVELGKNLLKDNELLIEVKYFTSRISKPPEKQRRQNTYLEALEALDNVKIFWGKYQSNPFECFKCGNKVYNQNEKKTDVNIAVELLSDAFTDKFDKAIIISADSDLIPPIQKIKELFGSKNLVVAFPPKRCSKEIQNIVSTFTIGEHKLKQSQLPEFVVSKTGFNLQRPNEWK